MSHDLKINYDDLCGVLQSVRDYREALAEISGASAKFLAALQNQKSETYKALSGVWKQKIQGDATELDHRLEVLEDLLNRYINAMADHIEPTNFSAMTRVDKSDISYNLYQMESAGRNLQTICWDTGSSWVDYRTYIDPESPGAEWERAQQDAEQWRRISNYNKLQSFRDDIAGAFSEEIKSTMDKIWKIYYDNIEPFESTDDKFAFEAGEYYLRWASNKDHFESVECAIKDVGRGIAGQLSDIWEGLEVLGLASNQDILAQRVMGEADPEVEARVKGFEQGLLHSMAHPINAVETIGQSTMDKLDEEGLAYGIGYIGTDVAIGALTQKALGSTKGATAGKVVDVVDDKLDDVVGATGDMAHVTNEATNLADDMGKLADEVSEIGVEGGTRTVNEFDTTVNTGKQGKHIIGNNNYTEGRSVFYGTVDDAQRLVDEFAGTGEWIGTNKERVNFGEVIGQYVNPVTNEAVDTTVGIIHYSKTGTHIVPAQPIQ